jgi:hypothetical protein
MNGTHEYTREEPTSIKQTDRVAVPWRGVLVTASLAVCQNPDER